MTESTKMDALTRRKFLTLTGVGVSTVLIAPLLAACGDEDDDTGGGSNPTTVPTATQADEPTSTTEEDIEEPDDEETSEQSDTTIYTYAPQTGIERDEMVIAVQGLPATIDPPRSMGNVGTRVVYTPYDTLIRRDFLNNNEHVPSLAVSWERLSDLELELHLREDVTFHNGDPFTADDVVFTFERLINAGEDTALIEGQTYFAGFSKVEKVDDYTVLIETFETDPVLVKRLASWAAWIVPKNHVESVGIEEFMYQGMGTGPYMITAFDESNEMVMERYDGYWGDPAPVKKITFRVIPEIAARVTALVNDEVQLITNVPPDQVATINSSGNVEVRAVPLANTHVLAYNTRHPRLQDKKLRQALNLGIDRELIIETIWSGQATLKRGHQFEEYNELYNADRPYTPYDPERARELLAESSYNGEEIEYQLQAGYYTNGEQVAQAIVPMWQEIGINAVVKINENSTSGDERQVHTWSNSSRLADPDGSLWVGWGEGSSGQRNHWDAPQEFNDLGNEARSTLDEQVRYDNYQKMLDIWEDEAPGTVLFDPVEFYGVSKSVNWSPYPFYYMDLRPYNLSFND